MHIDRRQFIRGSGGACLCLPLLETFAAGRNAGSARAPLRTFYLTFPFGRTDDVYPDPADVGFGYRLTDGLKPLEAYKDDFSIVTQVTNKAQTVLPHAAHASSTIFLTGANVKAKGGYFDNSVSCDQVLAKFMGKEVRYPSMVLDGGGGVGFGTGGSMSWAEDGSPIFGEKDPVKIYNKLFVQEDVKKAAKRLAKKRSVLDTALANAKDVYAKVSLSDQRKLDEYFQSIRQIEADMVREIDWLTVPKPKQPDLQVPNSVDTMDQLKIVLDMMILAMQTDSTRVWTYRMPAKALFSIVKAEGLPTAHGMSHYKANPSPIYKEGSMRQDEVYSDLIAYYIQKLKNTPDVDGQPMFENVIGNFGSSLRSGHSSIDASVIVFGRGGGTMRLGQHIAGKSNSTPMCNVWLTQMQAAGMEIDHFSDSDGVIGELRM